MDGRGHDSHGLVREAIKLLMLALATPPGPPRPKRRATGPTVVVLTLGGPEASEDDEEPEAV